MNQFSPRTSRRALVAAMAGAALALSACSGGGDGSGGAGGPQPAGGDGAITVFNGSTGTVAENFNPFSPTALQPTLGVVHEALFYYNLAAGGDPEPLLGESFSWNEDGTQLTVVTREGVTWSDGEPFTANDVAFTFNLLWGTPELNTSGIEAEAEATSDTEVVFTFPTTSFVQEAQILGNQAIVPEHVWADKADPATDINTDPVGTGAYTVDTFSPQSYSLAANPDYWGGAPEVQNVRYIALATADAASSALLAGEVDWMSAFFPGFQEVLADEPDLSWINTPGATTTIHTCSNAELGCEGPQSDPAVRQAIYQALDREQLNQLAFAGIAQMPSTTMLLPDRDEEWIADPEATLAPETPDVEAARATLEAAGWTEGADGIYERDGERLSMTIQVVSGYSDFISAIDAMTQQLAAAGIELSSTQLAYNEWNANQQNGTFQLSMDSIGFTPSTDPYYTYFPKYTTANTLPVGESVGSNNFSRYSNPVVDEAVATAAGTEDQAVKAEQYAVIQEQIATDLPYIPVVIGSTLTEFSTARATGWPTDEDTYAFPASWKSWDNGIVLKNLELVAPE
ncbi:ABC transporter substrate-binding protein [uncultured Pseudokineococcus sp.]|uniref:ABC transporter substrate-binding protein n=1 Tax=uncultured Pseudokineococcus sp. TaxID=1642928 RepID=UPI002632EA88|nr:ABC transporter substrate-binding protein [uncultured Pseudokineococcus sp.]